MFLESNPVVSSCPLHKFIKLQYFRHYRLAAVGYSVLRNAVSPMPQAAPKVRCSGWLIIARRHPTATMSNTQSAVAQIQEVVAISPSLLLRKTSKWTIKGIALTVSWKYENIACYNLGHFSCSESHVCYYRGHVRMK